MVSGGWPRPLRGRGATLWSFPWPEMTPTALDEGTSTVAFFTPFEDFTTSPLPDSLEAYLAYSESAMQFIEAGNRRTAASIRARRG